MKHSNRIHVKSRLSLGAAGTGPLSYQWRLNGTNIDGATNSTLTVTHVQAANQGSYSVVVNNAYGTVTSSSATLTVKPLSFNTNEPGEHANDPGRFSFAVGRFEWSKPGGDLCFKESGGLAADLHQSAGDGIVAISGFNGDEHDEAFLSGRGAMRRSGCSMEG
ncbi:MAG: hypothetical protein JWR26_3626 [Pedosphaera sp.]|nr:hypothetical protein [Pedosphaera sp.]